jgi:hypothetical protein
MRIKATFRTDEHIVAEYFFDVNGSPPAGTSGDLAERAKTAFDKFARNKTAIPLVNGESGSDSILRSEPNASRPRDASGHWTDSIDGSRAT